MWPTDPSCMLNAILIWEHEWYGMEIRIRAPSAAGKTHILEESQKFGEGCFLDVPLNTARVLSGTMTPAGLGKG